MDDLHIAATDRTPAIRLDCRAGRLVLEGESYPEDIASFYAPVTAAIERHLAARGDQPFVVVFELVYFNSGSANVIMSLLERLDAAARDTAPVHVHWRHAVDDDVMQRQGEELAEDFEHLSFKLESTSDDDA